MNMSNLDQLTLSHIHLGLDPLSMTHSCTRSLGKENSLTKKETQLLLDLASG